MPYRTATGCHDGISLLKELVAHHNRECTDVHGAMVHLSKAYVMININSLCDKIRATYSPGKIVDLIKYMCKNTFLCTFNQECLRDEWKVGNGLRQRGFMPEIFLMLYIIDVKIAKAHLFLGFDISGNRVNIFCYPYDIALLAPTENAIKFMLDTLAPKLEKFVS